MKQFETVGGQMNSTILNLTARESLKHLRNALYVAGETQRSGPEVAGLLTTAISSLG